MTDPLAYGEGLGASVIILAGFLGILALAQVVAYLRHQVRARRNHKTTTVVSRLAGMTRIGGTR